MHKIKIRKATETDIETVLGISAACDLERWTATDYREETRRPDSIFLVASIGVRTTGFISGRQVPASSSESLEAEIYNIGVRPDFQGKGVGDALLQAFFVECREMRIRSVWLDVRTTNGRAIAFYVRNGFEKVATRACFYNDPQCDALVMRCRISSSRESVKTAN